ncbi:hypothetical protein Pmani_010128 [Petrolisthes manimaculis]|uniref:Ig-like domain-containing protein n=1 Tax=Petrolisthes manimaculis TaxID=1843537 RepID=A0AAE1Q3Q8_9EUCA|nr:hypothetical protein Pmani_010128 [Petrolisthes manimaculis]
MLVVNVSKEHNGANVTCRAANPASPGSPITNSTSLTVHYPPSVTASMGKSLKASLLKEGDDVYFTCTVDANPPATSLVWFHEDVLQVQNVSAGVIISRDSLVVQKVQRARAGQYRCRAANTLAATISNPVTLKIRYRPECRTTPTTYFIYDKPINVTCTVTSHPPPSTILWRWNSSSEVIRTPRSSLQYPGQEEAAAQLTVYPEPQQEDRALSCWAVNEMGRQNTPCGFSVKVASFITR